jgi:hypothetical protein
MPVALLVVVVVAVVDGGEGFSTIVVQLGSNPSNSALQGNRIIFIIDSEGEVEALPRPPWAPWSAAAPMSSRNSRRVP